MSLTSSKCFWYAVLYAYLGLGTGYWIRRAFESLKSKGEKTS
ncbi:unnamed protein product [marine sediment metagenome]|uniref:Uncharacterized protein n=1 Tax=marine sediment metagenome TaxID=412755 RepID=X1KF90_9ZZZZ